MSTWGEAIGMAAAILSTGTFAPQALKVIRSRQTSAISATTYAIATTSGALWLAYGVHLHSWPIIGANVVTVALASVILALKLRYG